MDSRMERIMSAAMILVVASVTAQVVQNILVSYYCTDPEVKLRRVLDEELKVATVLVDNGLDKDVNVQIQALLSDVYDKPVDVGSPFTVSALETDARTLTPETSGWLPYVTVKVWCSTSPSSGSLTVWLVRGRDDKVKLVDALEIRDASEHTPSTDASKVLVREW